MVVKSQIVLYIYDELINNKPLKMDEVLALFNISVRTFRRYISEINAFFCNNYINKEIMYDYKNQYYYLS